MRVGHVLLIVLTLAVTLGAVSGAQASKRVALVIGNSEYTKAPVLKNAVNDAVAVREKLRALGFEVLDGTDLDLKAMRGLIRDFSTAVSTAEIGLFFYAGHGIQVSGKNYLLPVDASLEAEADLDFATIDVDLITRQLDRGPATKILLLDACRDNPFERQLTRSMGATRSVGLGRGLAKIRASGGSLIAFATEPGQVALDGRGANSPFTSALLKHLGTHDLEINVLMTRVRKEVYEATEGRQLPWTNSSLIGEVYLAPTVLGDVNVTVAAPASPEVVFWQAAERGGTAPEYEAYLVQYPQGTFASLARVRLDALLATAGDAAAGGGSKDTVVATLDSQSIEDALELTRAARREIQERLSVLGHDPRGIDGVFGSGTRSAIRAWQGSSGRAQTGYLTEEQIAALEAASDDGLAAFRADRRRLEAVERQRREQADRKRRQAARERQQQASENPSAQTPTQSIPSSPSETVQSGFRAVASCGSASGVSTSANRQQAMLGAAKACVSNGGAPACCAQNVSVK